MYYLLVLPFLLIFAQELPALPLDAYVQDIATIAASSIALNALLDRIWNLDHWPFQLRGAAIAVAISFAAFLLGVGFVAGLPVFSVGLVALLSAAVTYGLVSVDIANAILDAFRVPKRASKE